MQTYRIRLPRPDHQQQFADIPLHQLHQHANQLIPQFKPAFKNLKQFVLFIGYPRSGHSLVGSLLDAHRHVVISHEADPLFLFSQGFSKDQILSLILENSQHFARVGRGWTGYSYQVPHSHQGKFTTLKVIGDKMGSRVTDRINQDPGLIDAFHQFIGLELKFIHHTRNPFDIIGTMSARGKSTFAHPAAISQLTQLVQTNAKFIKSNYHIFTNQHEYLIQNPNDYLTQLFEFLNLKTTTKFLKNCSQIIQPKPHLSRHKVTWNQTTTDQINHLISTYSFLDPYNSSPPVQG